MIVTLRPLVRRLLVGGLAVAAIMALWFIISIVIMGVLTAAAAMFGDAILVPITEVGSLAVGVGWLSACLAYIARRKLDTTLQETATVAWIGAAVSVAIILMKIVPGVPGGFSTAEWMAFAAWSAFGLLFWFARPRNLNLGKARV